MNKLIFTFASLLLYLSSYSFSNYENFEELISKKKDSLKNDTMFFARRLGNEIKFTFNKTGELAVLLNEKQNITIDSSGNIGLGNNKPQYRIDVCGSIRASEELLVETNQWCDYVFDSDYKIQDFNLRINQIKENKHLPYLKSESEILEKGIPMSETLIGILQNVEELYLYLELLEQKVSTLEQENTKLKAIIKK